MQPGLAQRNLATTHSTMSFPGHPSPIPLQVQSRNQQPMFVGEPLPLSFELFFENTALFELM
jgi:hypothetical protein